MMRRRRVGHRWYSIVLWALLVLPHGPAQTPSLPPAIEAEPAPSSLARPSPLGAGSDLFAEICATGSGTDSGCGGGGISRGRNGCRDARGHARSTSPPRCSSPGYDRSILRRRRRMFEQALALQLQAKVLWVPNLNGGVDYFRHDGVQQNIFTGANFRLGRQSFFVGGGPSLVGWADRRDLCPAGGPARCRLTAGGPSDGAE